MDKETGFISCASKQGLYSKIQNESSLTQVCFWPPLQEAMPKRYLIDQGHELPRKLSEGCERG